MRNPKMMKRVSVKCAAAIMTAVMTMSPVAGAVAMPLVAYAADYYTTEDVPVDNENHRNLAVGDNLATNTGIIHENNGTITDNYGTVENNSGTVTTNIGTVNNNSGQVTDNYGTVNNTSTQPEGTVGTNHINSRVTGGNTTDNYGNVTNGDVTNNYSGGMVTDNSATVCVVQNNYGTVNGADNVTNNVGLATGVASVTNNYGNAENCGTVGVNYSSGTVQGNTEVTNNYGGTLGTGIVPNYNGGADAGTPPTPAAGRATDPAPNPPAAPAPLVAPEPAPTPEPEPEPAPAIEEGTTIPATNSASIAINTPELEALVATTPEQALILDPVALSGGAALVTGSCDLATIALAKAEVLSDPAIINSLKNLRIGSQYGTPNVTGAGTVAASDGRAIKSQTVNIECAGLTSAKGVAVLVYTLNSDGTKLTRVVKPRFSKGKLRVQLPVPCEYVIVQNVGI